MIHAPGKIIVLNGSSACGKSSIQKEFQKISDELYLTIGIDGFFDIILPDVDDKGASFKGNQQIRSVTCSHDENGNQLISLHVGELGHRVIRGMHRAIAAYAQQGCNLIVDYIAYDPQWISDLIKVLQGYTVYVVGVNAPIEVIEQRESKRSTLPIG